MTAAEHRAAAEQLLAEADAAITDRRGHDVHNRLVARAHVHALLATVSASVPVTVPKPA